MTDKTEPPGEGAEGRLALTPDQDAALKVLGAGEGEPLALAKILRPVAHFLESYPLDDTRHARTVRGLVLLSSPDAFALAESGRVSVDLASEVGHYARRAFAYHHPLQVCEDFQLRAMTCLVAGKSLSAIEEIANDILEKQKKEQLLLDCERIWREPYWSVWNALSWIAFRALARLCEIKDEESLRCVKFYGSKHYGPSLKEAKPESLLLAALRNDELKAIRNGAELPDIYWADKYKVDRDVRFRRMSVRRCWPGRGEWNGFQDEFWSLGQMILWIITRDPDEVDQASDDAGRAGPRSGFGGFAAAVKLEELLREGREQVEDVANDLRRRCARRELKALSGQIVIPATAWIDLTVDFEADGVPFVRRLSQGTRDPAYDNIRFLRVEALDVFEPVKTPEDPNLRHQLRTGPANEFNRKQDCIALGKRRWLRLTEIAREYARKPKSLGEIDDAKRKLALEELRYSIKTREFVDKRGRSRVLNMHLSPVARLRFDPEGASHPKLFKPIAEHLWITYQDCVDWFNRHDVDLPHRLQREPSSRLMPGAEADRHDVDLPHRLQREPSSRLMPGAEASGPASHERSASEAAASSIPSPNAPGTDENDIRIQVPRRQLLEERPVDKRTGRFTVKTLAWDVMKRHPEWSTSGIPADWPEYTLGVNVTEYLMELLRKDPPPIDVQAYGLRTGKDGCLNLEISPESVDRALVPRQRNRTEQSGNSAGS